jgi:Tol biopolymer transport system component
MPLTQVALNRSRARTANVCAPWVLGAVCSLPACDLDKLSLGLGPDSTGPGDRTEATGGSLGSSGTGGVTASGSGGSAISVSGTGGSTGSIVTAGAAGLAGAGMATGGSMTGGSGSGGSMTGGSAGASGGVAGGEMVITGMFSRVSVSSEGVEAPDGAGEFSLSADGRFVAFSSGADNLVPGDTNGTWDIFIRDRLRGVTFRASLESTGGQRSSTSSFPGLSPDGQWLSYSTSVVGAADPQLVLRRTGPLDPVGAVPGSTQAGPADALGHRQWFPALSRGGDLLVYVQDANLYAYDLSDATTTTLNDCDGASVLVTASTPLARLSHDGGRVMFWGPSSTYTYDQVFVSEPRSGTCRAISLAPDGAAANGNTFSASLSGDGRYATFVSEATNLSPDDDNGAADIFVRDLETETTRRLDITAEGGVTIPAAASGDGNRVAFHTPLGLYLYDVPSGRTVKLHEAPNTSGHGPYFNLEMSDDGSVLVFASPAANVVPGDTNDAVDIFAVDIAARPP